MYLCCRLINWDSFYTFNQLGVILSIRLGDEWVSAALSGHLDWALYTTANSGNILNLNVLQPVDIVPFRRGAEHVGVKIFFLDLPHFPCCSVFLFHLLSPPDCNRPADRSEDPDSDSNEPIQCPQATVHSDYSWQLRGRKGHPGLTRQSQRQTAHLHCCRQPHARKNTGTFPS